MPPASRADAVPPSIGRLGKIHHVALVVASIERRSGSGGTRWGSSWKR